MTESEFVAMVDISLPYGFEKCPTLDDYTEAFAWISRNEAAIEVARLQAQLQANYAQQAAMQNQQAQYLAQILGQLGRAPIIDAFPEYGSYREHRRNAIAHSDDDSTLVPPANRGRLRPR